MDTIKTAFVVALLLAVLYGVYVVLNKEPAAPPPEVADMLEDVGDGELLEEPSIESGAATDEVAEAESASSDAVGNDVPVPPPISDMAALEPTTPEYAASNPSRTEQYPGTDLEAPLPDTTDPSDAELSVDNTAEQLPAAEDSQPIAPPTGYDVTETQPDTDAVGTAPANPSWPAEPSSTAASTVEAALQQAQSEIDENQYAQALLTLSAVYTPDATNEQRKQLEQLLDPLAAKVIYSREHFLAQPYTARGDETLMQIALQYKVPWQLLRNINGIENPDVLISGTILKVVEGPFHAQVDTERGELTLYLKQLYAGRFPISVGNDPRPIADDYMIMSKETGRPYYAADGSIIPANDAKNPYGDVWMDLGNKFCIHGSPTGNPAVPDLGCISLSPRDAQDVFGILSEGSRVTVIR